MHIRLSTGAAVQLGLHTAKMEAAPTTLYAMLGAACAGSCRFCTQSRLSAADPKFLSRISWPRYELAEVAERLAAAPPGFQRLCIQTTKYAGLLPELLEAVTALKAVSAAPLSVCMNPAPIDWLYRLRDAGVERVGVGLDCATTASFAEMKPGFDRGQYERFILETVEVFGHGSVHLIVGLGDSDAALARSFQKFHDAGCSLALFALTPVRGAALQLPPPPLGRYRALQLTRHLITHGQARYTDLRFDEERLVAFDIPPAALETALASGGPFRTSGCPGCNRPLYNERPGGARYNFPRALTAAEITQARSELQNYFSTDSAD